MKHFLNQADPMAALQTELDRMIAPVTYDSPLSVTLSVQDWLGIRTQLAFAAFNNRARGEVATAEVTGKLLDKLYDQTQSALDAAADAADAEDVA